ncbi:MAG: branched-chain amino acid aminotransferase/4-amino-4-deoxychorismate lyase [Eubacterium sp.]|jgi:branched-chain amino acid aminotransferase|nr:branched-chain amino acid aminotransferase/4-amino-4-deoxychorismate lyase [Eubacterium sp.]
MNFEENIGKICIINGEASSVDKLEEYTDEKYTAFYEVIRIINGVPLFFEDHFTRLKNSMTKLEYELSLSKKALRDQIKNVCELNNLTECNVKVIILQYEEEQNLLLFINKFYYPSLQEYDNGVPCCTLNLKRKNPNVKMIHAGYKEELQRTVTEKKAFEALLVDEDGKITEGGKSNVFFVKGNRIYTSPEDFVLIGITRQYVVDVCTKLGYEIIETLIGLDSLKSFDAAFITGTSIKVLPVSNIDDYKMNSAGNPTTQHVMASYNSLVNAYINDNL